MKTSQLVKQSLILSFFLTPSLAHAHIGFGAAGGFLPGATHPLTGLDHICAMIAVGLWAAQRGGRALWLIPLTFVAVMAVGGAIGMAGLALPFVEKGIVISVLALGVLIAAAVRLPLAASALIVGLFAVFHGHAHGAAMPHTASSFAYGAGFVFATAMLHACGAGLGLALQRITGEPWIRAAGVAIAGCGVCLIFV